MNNKFKKIITATLITTASATMIGCGTPNTKLAKNIDKGMAEFVTSINNLDYVDTTSGNNLGKIVETASVANTLDDQYLTKTLEEINTDNTITLPSERNDNFKLFILSEQPFISFTSSDNSATINMQLNFSTEKISNTSNEINTKINNLILKRSILMIYVNEIYNNRVNLSDENRVAINAYVNVIKENASYLSGNRGMVNNQLTLASDLMSNNSNNNLINYYMIKSGEALETRSSKIDSTISAINSIIDIIENNLDVSSIYYQSSLSKTYENIIENFKSTNTSNSSNTASIENKKLADNIASSLNICEECNENNNSTSQISTTQSDAIKSTNTLNNRALTNSNVNDNTKTNSNKNLTTQNIKDTKNSQTNITTNQNNSKQKLINQNTTQNQNNLDAKNSTNSQNHTNLRNLNNTTNSQIQSTQNHTQRNINDLQNRKNANLSQINQNSRSNMQNITNFNQNQMQKNSPTTLDIPRDNSLNLQKQTSQDTFDIERNNRKNQTEVNSRTNLLDDSNHSTNPQTLNTLNNRRRNTSNPQINNTHENIKRVPYIKTLD